MSQKKQSKPTKIPLQTIRKSTNDFHESNFIGLGGFGKVYKGILSWGDHVNQLVAVKRLHVTSLGQGIKEYNSEVTMLSRYPHKNIITLIGFCDDNKEMILVYEYASRGSLDSYLRNTTMSSKPSWLQLLKICTDVASALDYLHNHVAENHRIIHRDIKSANVLLDENWNAKLADFGLARIGLANQQNSMVITNLAGTHGYCDPQYEETGLLTKESDVYSLGVLLFEVLCGRMGCDYSYNDERRFLHHLARTHYNKGELLKIIDNRIRKDIKPRTLLKFVAIAHQCLEITREKRPTIDEVLFQLKVATEIQLEDETREDKTTLRCSHSHCDECARIRTKIQSPYSSVNGEVDKRLKDLQFTQLGKDLIALKQILEDMQSMEARKEGSVMISVSNQNGRSNGNSYRNYESPTVIMKSAKVVERERKKASDHPPRPTEHPSEREVVLTTKYPPRPYLPPFSSYRQLLAASLYLPRDPPRGP